VELLKQQPGLSSYVKDVDGNNMNRWPSIPIVEALTKPGVAESLLASIGGALLDRGDPLPTGFMTS
jgi:hypothetical protein